MDSNREIRVPSGQTVGLVILAVIVGALLPVAAIFQLELAVTLPVLMLGGVYAVFLHARAGWVPAGALIASALASAAWLLGFEPMLMLAAAAVLPALVVMRGVAQRQPFFRQLRQGLVAFVLGLLAAMLVAYATFGGSMISRFMDVVRQIIGRIPDASLQAMLDALRGALPEGAEMAETLTVENYRGMMMGALDMLEQFYAQMLPGALFSGALFSGALAVLWGNWTKARRGMATNDSFVGLSRWFLPANVAVGAIGLWLAGFILLNAGYGSGETVYATTNQIAGTAFYIQALAALDRRLIRGDRPLPRRRLAITLLVIASMLIRTVASVMTFVGLASALFGTRGAVKLWAQRRQGQDDHSDRDDPDR
ncbi:MAG: hypothetical protein Q4C10_02835 [Clostridia bacterium]|nr:hypothetical protein [Clostridia bacterium]